MSRTQHTPADEAVRKFLNIFHYLRRYARQVTSHGVKPKEFAVLLYLKESEQATVGQVQDHLLQSASATSTLIANLEDAGFVTRTRSKQDNRVVIAELTPAGHKIAEETPLGGIPLLRRRLNRLPPDQLQRIDEALAEIMQLMEVSETE